MLDQRQVELNVETRRPGFIEISDDISEWLREIGAGVGQVTVFIRHTSASLTIQENADPAVQTDLATALDVLAPRDRNYVHNTEGPDDMPAHIRSMLTSVSLTVPVQSGAMMLGTWQGVYLVEHRDRPHRRKVVLHYVGEVERS